MATSLKRSKSPRLAERNNAIFLFGKAMVAWARLESGFYGWFEHATLLDMRQAKPLYYSATNFKARLDLLRAAISGTKLEAAEQEFIKAAIKLSIEYNTVRNKLAHGEMTIDGLVIEESSLTIK